MDRNTIHEAARIANVSVASVSRALNNKPGLGAETRARILSVCADLGYAPSVAARQLKEGRAATVGLSMGLHDWQVNPYVSIMFEHLTKHLYRRGLMPGLYHHSEMKQLTEDAASAILLGVEDGDARLNVLHEQKIPYVCIGRRHDGFWVCPDDHQGGVLAAEHLIAQGARRLATVEIDLPERGTVMRGQAFHEQVRAQTGLPGTVIGVPDSATPVLTAYRAVIKAYAQSPFPFDGVFCETDEIACGVRAALQDLGYRVPDDVRLVGYDDLPVFAEGLTTVRQDISAIAHAATGLLTKAQQGARPESITMAVSLIKRGST